MLIAGLLRLQDFHEKNSLDILIRIYSSQDFILIHFLQISGRPSQMAKYGMEQSKTRQKIVLFYGSILLLRPSLEMMANLNNIFSSGLI